MADIEVQNQQIAGCALAVGTERESEFQYCCGHAQIESDLMVDSNTVFRIASMTKPITSLAVMILLERGQFLLDDPIENYLSEFADMQVLEGKRDKSGESMTRSATASITIRHLLTHTSGIGYSFSHPQLGKRYRQADIRDWGYQDGTVIQQVVERLAAQPLAFDPGEQWLYGLNSDVLGRFVEVVSGRSFAEFLQHEIFDPLGMDSTRFYPNALQQQRLATVYTPDISKNIYDNVDFLSAKESFPVADNAGLRQLSALEFESFVHADFKAVESPSQAEQVYYSGGAGLHSTLEDYSRFCQMMLGEGERHGKRLVSRTTIELMRSNNIGNLTINLGGAIGSDQFGLGFAIIQDIGVQPFLSAAGMFYWGGAYNTRFILDPVNRIYAISLTQLYPNFHCDWNNRMIGLVYQALS
ncbi:MAG: serine hydrolase domain-containing protein [Planctomycetota bacterium]|nr:serine hydrolase domain-containing protein [Planctomycetota bacterium]